MAEVQILADSGQIQLIQTGAIDTELSTCTNEELREHLQLPVTPHALQLSHLAEPLMSVLDRSSEQGDMQR
jgi:hypothetical protein